MSQDTTYQDEDMPAEIDFTGAERGKFYQTGSTLNLPVYLENQVQACLTKLASSKGMELSVLVNELLRKDIELIEIAR
ncbi:MAG: hypothetical protein Q8Q28_11820 [Pseudomonadota bacterium]|nr:hypothetical protein [Pseudomonadota bacterium]